VASGAARRAKRDELLDGARRRELDAILVWKLERWGRSVADLGVAFVSIPRRLTSRHRAVARSPACSPSSPNSSGTCCESACVGASSERASTAHLGRPPTAAADAAEVRSLRRRNLSHAEIARRLGIGETSVRRILANGPPTRDRRR